MDMMSIQLDAWVVALLAGTISPILTAILTKLSATPGLKALIALLVTAVLAVVNAIVFANGEFLVRDMVILFVVTYSTHAVTYFNFWKPVGVPLAVPTAEVGVG